MMFSCRSVLLIRINYLSGWMAKVNIFYYSYLVIAGDCDNVKDSSIKIISVAAFPFPPWLKSPFIYSLNFGIKSSLFAII